MNEAADDAIMFFVMVFFLIVQSVEDLLEIFEKGIMKDPREMLMKMTVPEIKSMLKGVKKISHLRKSELIEVVLNRYDYTSSIVNVFSQEERQIYELDNLPSSPTPGELIKVDHQVDNLIYQVNP